MAAEGQQPSLNIDEMFEKELEAVLEEKARREAGNPSGTTEQEPLNLEQLEKELAQHPFFMKEMPAEGQPVPPLVEALQQLKYSEEDNTKEELLESYKKDALFHFKIKKWRIATLTFTKAMSYTDDEWEKAKLYNNRAACQFYIENYGSSLRDSEKALQLDPTYAKAYVRALNCCSKLNKWNQLIKIHKQYNKSVQASKEQRVELDKLYFQAVRNSKYEAAQERKSVYVRKIQEENDTKVLQAIEKRGIKTKTKRFLKRDSELSSDHRVQITTESELIWPVLIFYPHLGESDFIKEFYEGATFQEELLELLEINPPSWDEQKEFIIDNVDVYFTDLDGKYVKVPLTMKLKDVLSHKKYVLPENGVPAFLLLARGNPICDMMVAKMTDEELWD